MITRGIRSWEPTCLKLGRMRRERFGGDRNHIYFQPCGEFLIGASRIRTASNVPSIAERISSKYGTLTAMNSVSCPSRHVRRHVWRHVIRSMVQNSSSLKFAALLRPSAKRQRCFHSSSPKHMAEVTRAGESQHSVDNEFWKEYKETCMYKIFVLVSRSEY